MAHAHPHSVVIAKRVFFLAELDDLLRQCNEILFLLLNFHTVWDIGNGVLEYWSDGARGALFPPTHYSNIPLLHFFLGQHLDLSFDNAGRNDVALHVHLFRGKTQGQADELW